MAQRWQDVEQFTVEMATNELRRRGEVQPLLVAFAGDRPCFLGFLRWFPQGQYADPMIELLSLAMACDVDRLAFAVAGRLTSLDDPIPPVTAGADLRQRALIVEYADATNGDAPARHCLIHPFHLAGDEVAWATAVRLGPGQGWISEAIGLSVAHRGGVALAASPHDVRAQAERCVALGHELYLGPALLAHLAAAGLTGLRNRV